MISNKKYLSQRELRNSIKTKLSLKEEIDNLSLEYRHLRLKLESKRKELRILNKEMRLKRSY